MLDGSGWTANKSWDCQAPKTFCQIWSTTNRQICEKRSQGKAKTRLRIKTESNIEQEIIPKELINNESMNDQQRAKTELPRIIGARTKND